MVVCVGLTDAEGDDGRRKRQGRDEVRLEIHGLHVGRRHRARREVVEMRWLGGESALGGGASSEEKVDAVDVSMPCSVVDGRSPELVLGVNVRTGLQ
jgi:hypothetical protein